MTHAKILINQRRNKDSAHDQLGHQLAFTKTDDEPTSFTSVRNQADLIGFGVAKVDMLAKVSFYPMLWRRERAESRAVSRAHVLESTCLVIRDHHLPLSRSMML